MKFTDAKLSIYSKIGFIKGVIEALNLLAGKEVNAVAVQEALNYLNEISREWENHREQ